LPSAPPRGQPRNRRCWQAKLGRGPVNGGALAARHRKRVGVASSVLSALGERWAVTSIINGVTANFFRARAATVPKACNRSVFYAVTNLFGPLELSTAKPSRSVLRYCHCKRAFIFHRQ
jgi:hypothetical protein